MKEAIRIVNEVGGRRGDSGLPELLPGLNFVYGLIGETKETFRLNYEFLESLLAENLLVRRINVRQVMPFEGTCMGDVGDKIANKHKGLFHAHKNKVREHIDFEMLRESPPSGPCCATCAWSCGRGTWHSAGRSPPIRCWPAWWRTCRCGLSPT